MLVHGVLCYLAWTIVLPHSGTLHRNTFVEKWLQDGPGEQGVLNFGVAVAVVLLLWLIARFFQRPQGLLFKKNSI